MTSNGLEWFLIIVTYLGIIICILASYCIYQWNKIDQRMKKESKKALKKKKKKNKRYQKKIEQKKNRYKKLSILFLSIMLVLLMVGSYGRFIQKTGVTKEETSNITESYKLIKNLEQELSKEKITYEDTQNFSYITSQMATFVSKSGSNKGERKGQILQNQYYKQIGELGMNLFVRDYEELMGNKELLNSYIEDIKKIKKLQKKVLIYYKMDKNDEKK